MKHINKHIAKLGLVALVAALTASASAFPYSVAQRSAAPSQAANSPTIALSVHGRGVGQNKAPSNRVSGDLTYTGQVWHRGVATKSH